MEDMKLPHLTPACTVREVVMVALLAFSAGCGIGAWFDHVILGGANSGYFPVEAVPLDGDSVRITTIVHLDGYDAPELDAHRCALEHEAAARALERARQITAQGPSRAVILGQDRLGRVRARIVTSDRPLASMLANERLIRRAPEPTDWCAGARDDANPVQGMLALWP